MKEQLKTIRAGVAEFAEGDGQKGLGMILGALTQLEAMVGEQEPVARFREDDRIGHVEWLAHQGTPMVDGQLLFAAPVVQQPQAEAVPQAAEFCWLVEHFDGDGTGNSTGHYYTGKIGIADRVLTTMDANEAKRYDTWREANLASVKLGSTLTGTWRAVQHGFHTIPQQAEAVPPDVVRDAERYRWLRDQTTDDGIAIVMKNKCIDDSISYAENINKHIDAAIAQQKDKT